MTPQELIAEARTWIGTPYHHGGRIRGAGCDCVSFTASLLESMGLSGIVLPDVYKIRPDGTLLAHLERNRDLYREISVNEMQAGDVVLIRLYKEPQHFALYTGEGTVIHSDMRHGVVESAFDEGWRSRLVKIMRARILEA